MMIPRLERIAGHASSLWPPAPGQPEVHDLRSLDTPELQARLFFDFLRGQFHDAAMDLDALDGHVESPADRLAFLSLRAQILWSEGQRDRARSIIDYLLRAEGTSTERIEDTPFGLVVTKEVSPAQAWTRYLSLQAAEEPLAPGKLANDRSGRDLDTMPRDPFSIER